MIKMSLEPLGMAMYYAHLSGQFVGSRLHYIMAARTGPAHLREFYVKQARLSNQTSIHFLKLSRKAAASIT